MLEHQIAALESEIRGLEAEQAELVLKSPVTGKILELNPEVHPDRWISPHDMIALVGKPSERRVKGYVAESEVARISTAASGWFVPESVQRETVPVNLKAISVGSSKYLESLSYRLIILGQSPLTKMKRRVSCQHPHSTWCR